MIPRTSNPRYATIPHQVLSFLVFLFLSSTHGAVLDVMPSPCIPACRPIASSLENCQYLTCICNNQHGRDFQSCLTCLYQLSPTNETYSAAQDTLQSFQSNCRDRITFVLNITYISPSGTPSSTSIPATSINSTSASISISSSRAPSNSTSRSQTPTPTTASSNSTTMVSQSSTSRSTTSPSAVTPTGTLGSQEHKQMCRLRSNEWPRRGSYPHDPAAEKKPVNTRAVLAFLAVLVFIPIGVLIVRT